MHWRKWWLLPIVVLSMSTLPGCFHEDDDDPVLTDTPDLTTIDKIQVNNNQVVQSGSVKRAVDNASGEATLTLDKNTNELKIALKNVANITPTAIHIHKGVAGDTGGIELSLEKDGTSDDWNLPANTIITATEKDDFMAGMWYLNVHSGDGGNTQIRAQIVPPNYYVTVVDLAPPAGNSSSATGFAGLTLNEATGDVSVHARELQAGTSAEITLSHVHSHPDGDAVFDLNKVGEDATHWNGNATFDAAQMQRLKEGHYYLNLHKAGGVELTGMFNTYQLNIVLNNNQVLEANGVERADDNAKGMAKLTFYNYDEAIEVAVTLENIDATKVHIHKGPAGMTGDVEYGLEKDSNETWNLPANTIITPAQKTDLMAGMWYVNVHSGADSNTQIRAQIVPKNYHVSVVDLLPPAGVDNGATGFAGLTLNETTGAVSVHAYRLKEGTSAEITASHVHNHPDGGAVFEVNKVGNDATHWNGNATLDADQMTRLKDGHYYLNFHNANAAPNVELTGMFNYQSSMAIDSTQVIEADGVVRANGATATAQLSLYNKMLKLDVSGLANITATVMHIHKGPAGMTGAPVDPVLLLLSDDDADGTWSLPTYTIISDAQRAELMAGMWYVNVHSGADGKTQIRAQIVPQGYYVTVVDLAPPAGVDNGATGFAGLTLNETTGAVSVHAYKLKAGTSAEIALSHVHNHPDGDAVFELNKVGEDATHWNGNSVLDADQMTRLKEGHYYLNFHKEGGDVELTGMFNTYQLNIVLNNNQVLEANGVKRADDNAKGMAKLTLYNHNESLEVAVTLENITPTLMHIHKGPAGMAGGVEYDLDDDGNGTWNLPANTIITPAQKADLMKGLWYVNVHSDNGQMRAQIVPRGYHVSVVDLLPLAGVDTGAIGFAGLTLNETTGALEVHANVLNEGSPAIVIDSSHIHNHPTKDGIVTLTSAGSDPKHWVFVSDLTDSATLLTSDQMQRLKDGHYYLNFHNANAAPDNVELTGTFNYQLSIDVDSTQVLEEGGVDRATGATATAKLSLYNKMLMLDVSGLESITPTTMDIHTGPAGMTGTPVSGLTLVKDTAGVWSLPMYTIISDDQRTALMAGKWYVSVHSGTDNKTQIRGQIVPRGYYVTVVDLASPDGGTGSSEAGSGTSGATGFAGLTLNEKTGVFEVHANVLDAGTPGIVIEYAMIHDDGGDVVEPLEIVGTDAAHWVAADGASLTTGETSEIEALKAGEYYIKLHKGVNGAVGPVELEGVFPAAP